MTKPHEWTWFPAEFDWRVVVDNDNGAVIADVRVPANEGGANASKLISAAPDMARALLLWLPENGHTQECGSTAEDESGCSLECAASRKALRKAGVMR